MRCIALRESQWSWESQIAESLPLAIYRETSFYITLQFYRHVGVFLPLSCRYLHLMPAVGYCTNNLIIAMGLFDWQCELRKKNKTWMCFVAETLWSWLIIAAVKIKLWNESVAHTVTVFAMALNDLVESYTPCSVKVIM